MGFILGMLTFIGILQLIEYRKEARLKRWNEAIDNKINNLKENESIDYFGNAYVRKNN